MSLEDLLEVLVIDVIAYLDILNIQILVINVLMNVKLVTKMDVLFVMLIIMALFYLIKIVMKLE